MDCAGEIHDQRFAGTACRRLSADRASHGGIPGRGAACGRMPILLWMAVTTGKCKCEDIVFVNCAGNGMITGDIVQESSEAALAIGNDRNFVLHDLSGHLGEGKFVSSIYRHVIAPFCFQK